MQKAFARMTPSKKLMFHDAAFVNDKLISIQRDVDSS